MNDLWKAIEAAKRICDVEKWDDSYSGHEITYDADCKLVLDFLLSLNSPRWQDAPTEDGWYWVEGVEPVCYVYKSDIDESWMIEFVQTESGTLKSELVWTDLNGRRVCPIPPRPTKEDAK